MSDTPRLAVLIDADNTSHRHAGALLEEVARYGVPTVKRAYGDWTTPRLNGWKDELNRNAISPLQQFAYTTGKNSTDSALIIDAMDLLYTGNLDAFAIVSSDSDFTRLVTRLRESGRTVYGLGRRRTPQSLVAACDKFIYLEVLGRGEGRVKDADPGRGRGAGAGGSEVDADEDVDESDEDVPELPELEPLLRSAIDATSDDDGWSHLGAVGSFLNTRHASFDPRNYGFSKLIALVRAQDGLEVRQDGGSAPQVRSASSGGTAPADPAPTSAPPAKKTPRKRAPRKKAAAPAEEPPEQAAQPEPEAEAAATSPRVTTRTRGSRAQPKG